MWAQIPLREFGEENGISQNLTQYHTGAMVGDAMDL